MKLYNTLTRTIDPVQPQNPDQTTIYTCGPTVYDYAHIGHWFNYVRMDTLIRALQASGQHAKWVMNITDVGHLVSDADDGEDKLEKGAAREGKTAWEVAEFYTADFLECMDALHILRPDHITKATEHVPEQIALVQTLEAKGYTYIIDDGVYYDTSKFEGYAAFARLDLSEQQAGARVAYNDQKRNASDFALWKFSPSDHQRDMEWESPWTSPVTGSNRGFPGWHIECSAMSMKYLGDTLDIHTGGIDHIPVHHTNEIAQSEAATGKRFANYWLHGNHVMVEGEKISKSLGNGIRLQEIVAKGIPAEAVRLNVLESSYRSQSRFSMEGLEAAHNRLKGYRQLADLRWQPSTGAAAVTIDTISSTQKAILEAVQNDLATPQALAELSKLQDAALDAGIAESAIDAFKAFIDWLDRLFGLQLSVSTDLSEEQKAALAERQTARDNKDWAASDAARDRLSAQHIGLRDTPSGTIWYYL